ncbi:sigma 54-interacting transcriptional regulator [Enterococcus sp. AZ072]|uniref:sigma 54-interacting transcriptional regulator n=1 Tax=unclassified Enterococcus TaxID=2608891 RepID=UPI003D270A0D
MDTKQNKIIRYIRDTQEKAEFYTASCISTALNISRNNASHHLNRLVEEGVLTKINTRPTKFVYKENQESSQAFEGFIGYDSSLKNSIQKCKAAVNYPKGLPLMLRGESGTGKSYLASLIFQYAKDNGVIPPQAPLVVLNCADYANNPELLSSVLFGHIKGAFTGAETDKKGLIDEAQGGFLFLDEVHNLSAENQEKLFLLIDSQKFRRLGDNDNWQSSDVRLIMATTEEITSSLLTTFRRRIPLTITLPKFTDRPLIERHELVLALFQSEVKKVKKTIQVSYEIIEGLEKSQYEGNVGELKNEIKVMVAKHYSQTTIVINKKGSSDQRYQLFSTETASKGQAKKSSSLLELADTSAIKNFQGLLNSVENLVFNIHCCIKQEYGSYQIFIENEFEESQVEYDRDLVKKLFNQRGIPLEQMELDKFIELLHFFQHFDYVYPLSIELNTKERMQLHKYLRLAKTVVSELLVYTEKADQLVLFFTAFFYKKKIITSIIPAVIAMHGFNNATSMAAMANQLVNDYIYDGFDLPLELSSTQLIEEIVQYIKQIDTKNGLVVFVDMGSLEEMYVKITPFVEGDLLVLNNVSSAAALDIALQLKAKVPMNEIVKVDTTKYTVEKRYFEGLSQKNNILVTCLSGEGIAIKVKEILSHYFDHEKIEILTMDYKNVQQQFKREDLTIFKNTIAIFTTPSMNEQRVPVVNIEEIVNGRETLERFALFIAEEKRKDCINEIVKLFTIEGATARLTFLNPEMVVNEIEEAIIAYEEFYDIEIQSFIRINLFLHLSSMIERILRHDEIDEELSPDVLSQKEKFDDFLGFSKLVFSKIRQKYNIQIPKSEFGMVFQLINELISKKK